MNSNTKTSPLRPLWPFDTAARAVGLTPELLESAIKNGDIPGVRILHLGPRRIRYIRSKPFAAWIDGIEPPADQGEAADHAAEYAVAAKFDPVDFDDNLFQ